jgi:hypothetical protein
MLSGSENENQLDEAPLRAGATPKREKIASNALSSKGQVCA